MRTTLMLMFTLLIGSVSAQSKLKRLTDEEIMYSDKFNGTLVEWTQGQKDAFMIDCESNISGIVENSKKYCKCAMKSMMTGVNYLKYSRSSDYQKGRLTSLHGSLNCKAKKKIK